MREVVLNALAVTGLLLVTAAMGFILVGFFLPEREEREFAAAPWADHR